MKLLKNNTNNNNISNNNIKKKDKERAIIFAVLSATCLPFGLHKFYLGLYKKGIIYILFFWTLIPQIVSLIEFFLLIKMNDEEFDKKYNKPYLYFLSVEERKAKKEKIFKELEYLESINSNIDNSLDKNEKCFINDSYTEWYEYRKIKGDDSLELINTGGFYLTNKKIILVSNIETKKIELKDILEVTCNDDIELPNLLQIMKLKGKNVVLSFSELENMYKAYFFIFAYIHNLLK